MATIRINESETVRAPLTVDTRPKENLFSDVLSPDDFDAIRLRVASPDDILRWSHGEVTKPETINYRTQKPERDGLFCEKIFGPTKDWECYCGKYKRIRYKGVICDKCGVEVTRTVVRRERMGHIDLATPVTHIWFLRGVPSKIGLILDLSITDLEKVVYFASFVITKVDQEAKKEAAKQIDQEYKAKLNQIIQEGERLLKQWEAKKADEIAQVGSQKERNSAETKLEKEKIALEKAHQEKLDKLHATVNSVKEKLARITELAVLTESDYQDLALKFGHVFDAGIGAETIYELLRTIDLKALSKDLEKEVFETAGMRKKKAIRRLRLVKSFMKNGIRPEWMVLTRIPVIPPDLRPMVQLDGGRFATSDLNDLYRRVINRNNRLRRLLELNAPEVITRNEKRMLQEAVDALIDNSARSGKTITAATGQKRQLKSLADILKGKQGRFRQNLLGKRIDYSGRSVIVVGPKLQLHQCGLPKQMALELFRPFVISELIRREVAHNVRSANRHIDAGHDDVWQILEEITSNSHVLLNRAPTLHRLGIQAFQPKLVEGKAIQLHPLVCTAFNADFDGDQMAVHVPLTEQAKEEAANLMLSSRNLLKPADGEPVTTPNQDIVLGCYYLTMMADDSASPKIYSSAEEAFTAYQLGHVGIQDKIIVHYDGARVETTVGRLTFNEILPRELRFVNKSMDKKLLKALVGRCFQLYGLEETAKLLDRMKDTAFTYSTLSGTSFGAFDLPEIDDKPLIISEGDRRVAEIEEFFQQGFLTKEERYSKIIQVWQDVKGKIEQLTKASLPAHSSVGYLINSGARGNFQQLTQVVGMKGNVVAPSGELIEIPIKSSFKEGTNVLEYFISTHGTRKSLSDTALKTANAGYLTRRLCDVAQDVVVVEADCGNKKPYVISKKDAEEIGEDLASIALGRTLAADIIGENGEVVAKAGTLVEPVVMELIRASGVSEISIRSVLDCQSTRGVCQACYGYDLGRNQLVSLGTAVGIIAAQSIGEPGTQLTMRTFHSGGVAGSDITQGLPRVEELLEARTPKRTCIIAEVDGQVRIEDGEKMRILYIDYQETGEKTYTFPKDEEIDLTVKDGQEVKQGDVVFIYRESGREVSAAISGRIIIGKNKLSIVGRGKQTLKIEVHSGEYIRVKNGELVSAGQALTDGSMDLQELYKVKGREVAQRYMIKEIQQIYASQASKLNSKHLEVIVRQLFSWVFIEHEGDTELLPGEIVSLSALKQANQSAMERKGKPAQWTELLLGMTKASLSTDSWLSAASFQETARVLISAATTGKVDYLRGLKENVIIGRLIPAGTGYESRRNIKKIKARTEKMASQDKSLEPVEEPKENE